MANPCDTDAADWLWIQFADRDAITAWASHSGLVVDGDKPHISIPEEIRWENGTRTKSLGNLGQLVCDLAKSVKKLARIADSATDGNGATDTRACQPGV